MIDGPTQNTKPECPQCGAPVALSGYADVAVCQWCGSTLARELVGGPETAWPRRPDEQKLRSVQCSQCAGALSAREGKRVLVCDHCGVRVMIREHGGMTRWYFPPRVDRLKAAAAGVKWLTDYPGIAKQARNARFVDAKLVYAPIWEHRTLVAGWEFGYKVRTRSELVEDQGEGNERWELQLVREGVKEARLQERRFYQAATDFQAIGATRPRVTGRELLVPLLAGELDAAATVLDAEGDVTQVVEKGRRAALQPLAGAAVPDAHLYAFRESAALLYYPLWLVHFQHGRRPATMVVNGRDGSVNAAVAPASQWRRIMTKAGPVGALVVLGVVFLLLGLRWSQGRPLIAVAVLVFLVAAYLMWRSRPEKGVVEYHEPLSS